MVLSYQLRLNHDSLEKLPEPIAAMNLQGIFQLSCVLIYGLSLIRFLVLTEEARSEREGAMYPQGTTVDFRQRGMLLLKLYTNTCSTTQSGWNNWPVRNSGELTLK